MWRTIAKFAGFALRGGMRGDRMARQATLMYQGVMSDAPPDRLAADPASPHHDATILERGVGVRFKGVEKTNVEEYCVSERWVRLTVGTTVDRAGRPMTIKLKGDVEPYFRDLA